MLYGSHNEDIQIKNGGYIQHLDYTHKTQEYQQNYGDFCGFLEDSNLPSTEKRYGSPKGSCTPKVLFVLGRIKERICAFRLVNVGIFWKFVIILFHELIASGKVTELKIFILV